MNVRKLLNQLLCPLGYELARARQTARFAPDLTAADAEIIQFVRPYTMARTADKVFPIINAARHVVEHRILGDIVECGVWRGGMMMAAARTLLSCRDTSRELWSYDTFAGMVEPTDKDLDAKGDSALERWQAAPRTESGAVDWCYACLEDVARNLEITGYPREKLHLIKGRVEDTLPARAPQRISILRLDTDWYESSKHELVHLFPRLERGGVLILDDYGHWQGARQATDEYFKEHQVQMHLVRVDEACRVGVKL
jgi:hypothetical protein